MGHVPSARPVLGAFGLLLPAGVLVLTALLTPTAALFPSQGDVDLYRRTAASIVDGQLPYRDIPLPYPLLALVPMLAPTLVWPGADPSLEMYELLFVGWEAILVVITAWAVRRIAG